MTPVHIIMEYSNGRKLFEPKHSCCVSSENQVKVQCNDFNF